MNDERVFVVGSFFPLYTGDLASVRAAYPDAHDVVLMRDYVPQNDVYLMTRAELAASDASWAEATDAVDFEGGEEPDAPTISGRRVAP